jgi:hypothetical protein
MTDTRSLDIELTCSPLNFDQTMTLPLTKGLQLHFQGLKVVEGVGHQNPSASHGPKPHWSQIKSCAHRLAQK